MLFIYNLLGISAFIGALALFIKNYNNLRNIVLDILHFVTSVTGWFTKTSIKGDIQLIANKTIKDINSIVPELNMPDMEIDWVKEDEDGRVRFDETKAIVMLKFDKDRTQNVINSTKAYIHNTLLSTPRIYMEESITKAIDFTIIKKFLENTPQRHFATHKYIENNKSDINQYQDHFSKVNKADQVGLLTNVLLREYSKWGDRIITELPNNEYRKESVDVLDFVYEIASREFDDPTPLQLLCSNIKIGVLLVAKITTYEEKGIHPYVRRIREGFTNGINTFYLLARGERIEILKKVYGELIKTGNFICVNDPQTYKDNEGRECICYCIEVNRNGDLASDYAFIKEAINAEIAIELSIQSVTRHRLSCLYNNSIQVEIPLEEISKQDVNLHNYYTIGMTIEAIPTDIGDGGTVKASLLNTDCNPQKLMDSEFSVGGVVIAKVEEPEDEFVRLLVEGSDKQAYAFRRDLTFSKYLFLHHLYPVGSKFEFEIINIDYVSNQLRLKRKGLSDPWDKFYISRGELLPITIYKKEDTYFVSEIKEGIKVILPFSELAWTEDEIAKKKTRIRLNTVVDCRVLSFDKTKRIVIVTCRAADNPYKNYFESLGNQKKTRVVLESQNSSGVVGLIDNQYKIFIPTSETHLLGAQFEYKINHEYDVIIKHVADDGRSFIGTFRPFINHPDNTLLKKYPIGSSVGNFSIRRMDQSIVTLNPANKDFADCRICLHISEICNLCFIEDLQALRGLLSVAPLIIKEYNFERNVIEISLRKVLSNNNEKRNELDYDTDFCGHIIGQHKGKYVIVIVAYWIEGLLDMTTIHHIGDNVTVRLAAHGAEYADFYEVK